MISFSVLLFSFFLFCFFFVLLFFLSVLGLLHLWKKEAILVCFVGSFQVLRAGSLFVVLWNLQREQLAMGQRETL